MTLLTARDVRKGFGGVKALDGVTLAAEEGRITALIGPNGAGKTTLFNAFTGFESIDEGEICFDGRRIDRLKPWRVARLGLGRSFQTPTGFPSMSVWDNVMVAASDVREERFARACAGRSRWREGEAQAGRRAHDVLERLGLLELADMPLPEISAGDAKLVEIARQLVRRPRMLLLDEPAAGVDPAQVGMLAQRLRDLHAEGMTILLIDHNLSFVLGIADDVHVLALGRVIASGTAQEIARDRTVVEVYLGESHAAA